MYECALVSVVSPQNCDHVVQAIEDTGQIKREQKDLEDQVRHTATHTPSQPVSPPG